jgi:hypothetical protein
MSVSMRSRQVDDALLRWGGGETAAGWGIGRGLERRGWEFKKSSRSGSGAVFGYGTGHKECTAIEYLFLKSMCGCM